MSPIASLIIATFSKVVGEKIATERVATKSTTVGASLLAASGAIAFDQTPLADGSVESYVVMILTGVSGLVCLYLKRKPL